MTRRQKLLERFKSRPTDFEWSELVRLLGDFGYEERDGRGSRKKFVCDGRAAIILHKPHPGNIVKLYIVKYVYDQLESEGLI